MKRSRIVFSFDDARYDTYKAVKIAEEYGIKSTVNVTTAYVEGNIDDKTRPSVLPAMTIEQVVELSSNPYVELAGHSDNHVNDFEDIVRGRDKLQSIIKTTKALGFASPSSKINFTMNPLDKFKSNGFRYVRIGPKIDSKAKIYRYIRKISRIFHFQRIYASTYVTTLEYTIENNYLVHGVPVLNDNTVGQLKTIIQTAIKNENDVVLIFHSILPSGEYMSDDNWTWNEKKYIELCQYIKGLIEIGSAQSVLTYELIND